MKVKLIYRKIFFMTVLILFPAVILIHVSANDMILAVNTGLGIDTAINDPSTCHILYDTNGGKGTYSAKNLLSGEADTVMTPEDTGIYHSNYTFIEWNTQKDGSGTSYLPGDRIILNKTTRLYAQWSANDIPVFLDLTQTAYENTVKPAIFTPVLLIFLILVSAMLIIITVIYIHHCKIS